MKSWKIAHQDAIPPDCTPEGLIGIILDNRGLSDAVDRAAFLTPPDPLDIPLSETGIDSAGMATAVARIRKAVEAGESVIVYADYDADGVTAGAVMWEAIYGIGGKVMPYIPHRVDEGYGLSVKGIDTVIEANHPSLIVTVDHGVTCHDQVEYAKSKGIDVIVTDHHVKPAAVPETTLVHTTKLCGAGVAWFVARELLKEKNPELLRDLLSLAAIGTIADMVPLVGPNRSITRTGLEVMNTSSRMGIAAILEESGLVRGNITAVDVSHVIAPRLNAMGRLEHALDALRLLCTRTDTRARELAARLGMTNKDRQQLTVDTAGHAAEQVKGNGFDRVIVVAHESYNQGVIGLVAGKLVDQHYRPAIVISRGETVSKASARSIPGFNIIEALRECSDLLLEVGGHPMAAGFSIETDKIPQLTERMNALALERLTDDLLVRSLSVDCVLSLGQATTALWEAVKKLAPFGLGNPEPVFATLGVDVVDARLVGATGKHLKLRVAGRGKQFDCIGFGLGELYGRIKPETPVDIAYTVDMNEWNGRRSLQLKLRDLRFPADA